MANSLNSNLLVESIQDILHLLPLKDAVRASSLSKTWLKAWQTRSSLHFDQQYYEDKEMFLNYINSSLMIYREQKIGIKSINLFLNDSWGHFDNNEWIKVAAENGVKKFKFVYYSDDDDGDSENIHIPSTILEVKSLHKLTMKGKFTLLDIPRSILCRNLKSLHLRDIVLNELTLKTIFSSCQMIEDLEIDSCFGIHNFEVMNVPKLKKFWFNPFDQNGSIKVEASNLEFFHLSNCWCQLTSQNLKRLVLTVVNIPEEFFFRLKYEFPHLEDIELLYNDLQRIRISSSSIKRMKLKMDSDYDGLEELQIEAPNMTWFEYEGPLIPKVLFTSTSRLCCSRIHTHPLEVEWEYIPTTSWFCKLKEFLKEFSKFKIYLHLEFTIKSPNGIFDLEEAMATSIFFATPQIEELSFELTMNLGGLILTNSSTIFEFILDGIFWACRPKAITYSVTPCFLEYPVEEFIFKKLIVTRNHDYYISPLKFWEMSLKKVGVIYHIIPQVEGSLSQDEESLPPVEESLSQAEESLQLFNAYSALELEWEVEEVMAR